MKKIKQKGMSLLEVVVAMLVVGIALSGSLAMIQAANRFGLSAEFTSIAQQHAQSMIDRIRANSIAKKDYAYGSISGQEVADLRDRTINGANARHNIYTKVTGQANNKTSQVSCTTACTPQQIAQNDIAFQLSLLSKDLPSGTATIALDPNEGGNPNKFIVIIMWKSAPETTTNLNDTQEKDSKLKTNSYGIAIPFSI